MVSLVLGEFSNLIDEPQCGLKIRKRKVPFEMVVIHNFPVPDLSFQRGIVRRNLRKRCAGRFTAKIVARGVSSLALR